MTPNEYARTFLGVPYVWGGKNRLQGLDCSGLVCEVLKAYGLIRFDEALNSDGLWRRFGSLPSTEMKRGALLFYGKPQDLVHVALCDTPLTMIEAGGGGASTKDFHEAALRGAMVRIRPISYRTKDFVKAVMPPWPA